MITLVPAGVRLYAISNMPTEPSALRKVDRQFRFPERLQHLTYEFEVALHCWGVDDNFA